MFYKSTMSNVKATVTIEGSMPRSYAECTCGWHTTDHKHTCANKANAHLMAVHGQPSMATRTWIDGAEHFNTARM